MFTGHAWTCTPEQMSLSSPSSRSPWWKLCLHLTEVVRLRGNAGCNRKANKLLAKSTWDLWDNRCNNKNGRAPCSLCWVTSPSLAIALKPRVRWRPSTLGIRQVKDFGGVKEPKTPVGTVSPWTEAGQDWLHFWDSSCSPQARRWLRWVGLCNASVILLLFLPSARSLKLDLLLLGVRFHTPVSQSFLLFQASP